MGRVTAYTAHPGPWWLPSVKVQLDVARVCFHTVFGSPRHPGELQAVDTDTLQSICVCTLGFARVSRVARDRVKAHSSAGILV